MCGQYAENITQSLDIITKYTDKIVLIRTQVTLD